MVATSVFKSYFNYQPFPFDRQNLSFNFESSGLTPMFNLYSGKLEKSFNSLELYEWKKKSFDTGYYFIDERSYLTKIDEEGQIIFTEQVQSNQAVIELNNGDLVIGGGNAFLDGGYGGSATITRLSFSSSQ